jgi:hypothetical protein
MADIINVGCALLDGRATDMLRDAASKAAAECAEGGPSDDGRRELVFGMARTLAGYSITWDSRDKAPARPSGVLSIVLAMVVDECENRILSAEGRACLIKGVLQAIGGGWRVWRVAA